MQRRIEIEAGLFLEGNDEFAHLVDDFVDKDFGAQKLLELWVKRYGATPDYFYNLLRRVDSRIAFYMARFLDEMGVIDGSYIFDGKECFIENFKHAVECHPANAASMPYQVLHSTQVATDQETFEVERHRLFTEYHWEVISIDNLVFAIDLITSLRIVQKDRLSTAEFRGAYQDRINSYLPSGFDKYKDVEYNLRWIATHYKFAQELAYMHRIHVLKHKSVVEVEEFKGSDLPSSAKMVLWGRPRNELINILDQLATLPHPKSGQPIISATPELRAAWATWWTDTSAAPPSQRICVLGAKNVLADALHQLRLPNQEAVGMAAAKTFDCWQSASIGTLRNYFTGRGKQPAGYRLIYDNKTGTYTWGRKG